jgi:cysteine desulfurase / selenocysteine lyase
MSAHLSLAAVEPLRARTPSAKSITYFNQGRASLPPEATLRAIHAHLWREETEPLEAGAAAYQQSECARALATQFLNAQPEEIALITGNSPGWGAAVAALGAWRAGKRILVGRHEWSRNLASMRLTAQRRADRSHSVRKHWCRRLPFSGLPQK